MRAMMIWWGDMFIQIGNALLERARYRAERGWYE